MKVLSKTEKNRGEIGYLSNSPEVSGREKEEKREVEKKGFHKKGKPRWELEGETAF